MTRVPTVAEAIIAAGRAAAYTRSWQGIPGAYPWSRTPGYYQQQHLEVSCQLAEEARSLMHQALLGTTDPFGVDAIAITPEEIRARAEDFAAALEAGKKARVAREWREAVTAVLREHSPTGVRIVR